MVLPSPFGSFDFVTYREQVDGLAGLQIVIILVRKALD
jgi:hypothetical protein